MAQDFAPFDNENVFKKIIEGKIPSYKVLTFTCFRVLLFLLLRQIFETEDALAILDAFPVTRGHALLIPKASGYVQAPFHFHQLTMHRVCPRYISASILLESRNFPRFQAF